jgi:hypothetical protein
LFTLLGGAGKIGVYQLALADGTCTPLVPGAVTFGVVTGKDDKSFTHAVPSRHDVPIYRQGWQDGKLIGKPQVVLTLRSVRLACAKKPGIVRARREKEKGRLLAPSLQSRKETAAKRSPVLPGRADHDRSD